MKSLSDIKNIIHSNNDNPGKDLIWQTLNLAIRPLDFVCSEKLKKRINKFINTLACEDMPSLTNDLDIQYIGDMLYCKMLNISCTIDDQLREYMAIQPKILMMGLSLSIEIFSDIRLINSQRRNINTTIDTILRSLELISNNELIRLQEIYHR